MGKENIQPPRKKISRRKFLAGAAGVGGSIFFGASRAKAGGGDEGIKNTEPIRELPQTEINEIKTIAAAHIENIREKTRIFVNPELREQYEEYFEAVDVDKIIETRQKNPYLHNNFPLGLFISPNRGGNVSSHVLYRSGDSRLDISTSSLYDDHDHLNRSTFFASTVPYVEHGSGVSKILPELSSLISKSEKQQPYLPSENFQKAFNTVFKLPNEIVWDDPYIPENTNIVVIKGKSSSSDGKPISVSVNSYGMFSLVIHEIPPFSVATKRERFRSFD